MWSLGPALSETHVYDLTMGRSGMKRKGRRHLPKVGTRPAMDSELRDRRERALHPFSEDPSRHRRTTATTVIAIAVAIVVAVGVIAIILAP